MGGRGHPAPGTRPDDELSRVRPGLRARRRDRPAAAPGRVPAAPGLPVRRVAARGGRRGRAACVPGLLAGPADRAQPHPAGWRRPARRLPRPARTASRLVVMKAEHEFFAVDQVPWQPDANAPTITARVLSSGEDERTLTRIAHWAPGTE